MGKWIERFGKKKIAAAGIFLAAVVGTGLYIQFFSPRDSADRGNMGMSPKEDRRENMIVASGLTATGILEEKYELDFLETALYVEESYLSIGDEVEKGVPIFKVSDETLREAKEEVERAAREAELAYREGIITYETEKLEAESIYEKADINREYAQTVYENSLFQEKQKIAELTRQEEEAQALYDEYKAALENDYYRTYYCLDELRETYYDNFTFLMDLYEKWEIEELKDSQPNGGGSSTENAETLKSVDAMESMSVMDNMGDMGGDGKGENSFYNEDAGKISVYEMMEELVKKNGEEYEAALENYEKDRKTAEASLDLAKSNLAKIQAELAEAQIACEKQSIQGKMEYETTMTESKNAKNVYEMTVQKLDDELEALKKEMEEAEENRKLFEDTVGDGYFYTGGTGVVMMNMVRKGSYLTGESILLAYNNPDSVTVAVSVGQKDIAEVGIGDRAYVSVNGHGEYQGTVISIDPVSVSNSRASAAYTVNIELEGDTSGLESNLTAYAYLGAEHVKEKNE